MIPRATYRVQLHAGFTFAHATSLVPYWAGLGISHLYCSPFLKARAGSTHGYDIIDHGALNPEIGTMAELEALAAALKAHDMGLIMDFVPNHMGVGGADNAWWLDVLEWGEDSPYARFFDIDWQPPRRELKGKVLLPFLGDHYGAVLERGELVPRLDRQQGSLAVWYWDHCFPIALRDYPAILEPVRQETRDAGLRELLLDLRNLLAGRNTDSRHRKAAGIKAALARVVTERPRVAEYLDWALDALRRAPPRLHALLERQNYRISFWQVAADEINYRRFFDINGLAALRMIEEPELFDRAHALTFDLIRRGLIQGLRIDHVDGLFNPAEYCRRVQEGTGGIYLLVEKILAHHEPLRRDWPVSGTTGYDFVNQVLGLFVDGEAEAALGAVYAGFTGFAMDFEHEVYEAKKRIIDEHMAAELRVLAGRLGRIANSHWRSRDFTLSGLHHALKEVVAGLPVYRTYVTGRRVTDNDRRYIDWAVARARKLGGGDGAIYDFVHAVLEASLGKDGEYGRRAVVDFAMRLQQYSGPVMAKGFEDTALYRYNRLVALNEVGGDPTRFGLSPHAFHQAMRARHARHPQALLATATHDTKRGEDTRVRMAVLSELADEWRQHVERWRQLNAHVPGPAPEPNDEYWLYQTLLGAWPGQGGDFTERLVPAMVKAAKEAKRRTSWAHPDAEYEQVLADFTRRILETGRKNPFLDDFTHFHAQVAAVGRLNGLAQTLLKLTVPGVPDIYQGADLWDLSMVDPDNRRPVDYALRQRMLGRPLSLDWTDGAVKQELIRLVLDFRKEYPDLFAQGAYRPLTVRGPRAGNVVAFARILGEQMLVVAVPVLTARLWPADFSAPPLGEAWRGVHVEAPKRGAPARFRDLLTGAQVETISRRNVAVLPVSVLFARFPLCVLVSQG